MLSFIASIVSLTTTIIVLFIVSIIGLPNIIAQILYSIFIIPCTILTFYKFYIYVIYIFDGRAFNDNRVTFSLFLDLVISYILTQTLILFLTWIWAEDYFFSGVQKWNEITVFHAYNNYLLDSILLCTGPSFPVLMIRIDIVYSFMIYSVASLSSYVLFTVAIPFSTGYILSNIKSEDNNYSVRKKKSSRNLNNSSF